MLEFSYNHEDSHTKVLLKGRIDGITSSELLTSFSKSILDGNRSFILDFSDVNYISSVGIRVFMSFRKELDSAGGKMVFCKVTPSIKDIFKISGFLKIFQFADSFEDILINEKPKIAVEDTTIKETDEFKFKIRTINNVAKGNLKTIGKMSPFINSEYSQDDVDTIDSKDFDFGLGLATAGDNFSDYHKFFGESLLVNNNLFWYPSVKNPTVDYMISNNNSYNKQFLNGLAFSGQYSKIILAESKNEFSELNKLVSELIDLVNEPLFCIVIIFESKGLWGMNIKKVPFIENKPVKGGDIFADENFADWFNFPMEPEWNHHLVVSTGIIAKDKTQFPALIPFFPQSANFHLHSVVFERGFINNDLNLFDKELNRITTELNPMRVFHLLGMSNFKKMLAGIIIPEIK